MRRNIHHILDVPEKMIIDPYKSAKNNDFVVTIQPSLAGATNIDLRNILPDGETYDFVWNRGDGSSYAYSGTTPSTDSNLNYDYGVGTPQQMSFSGKVGGWSINNGSEKLKVTSVNQWGDVGFDDLVNAFYGCSNLTTTQGAGSIKSDSLSYLNFFADCTKLANVDYELLDLLVNATNLGAFFYHCYLLQNLPNVSNNVNVTSFGFFAYDCRALSEIPNNYFYYNKAVTTYGRVFTGLRNVTLPSVIFDLSVLNIVISFRDAFRVSSTSYSFTGQIQDIWNYTSGTEDHLDAFLNQTALSNYASIPNGWKGL